ncbi:hypothetical protein ACIBW9_01030 [Streptomyces sp. NPDC049541]|uniref:hypothetical protein n=1 Tax=Streptomyces sp. NPDC049541 TaxID=3365594 RepID=UPI00379DA8CA
MASNEGLMSDFKWFVQNKLIIERNIAAHRREMIEQGFTEEEIRSVEEDVTQRFASGQLFEEHTCPAPEVGDH